MTNVSPASEGSGDAGGVIKACADAQITPGSPRPPSFFCRKPSSGN